MGIDMFESGTLNETRRAMVNSFEEFLARQSNETAWRAQQQAMLDQMWGSLGNIGQATPPPQASPYYGIPITEMLYPKTKKEEKCVNIKIGEKYQIKFYSIRPSRWNSAGDMDCWMGKIVTIRSIRDYRKVEIIEDGGKWEWEVDDFEPITKEEKGMFQNVKDYIGKHRDMLFTLGLIVIVDHFLFNGALRERIKGSIEGMLKKVEDKFHKDEDK